MAQKLSISIEEDLAEEIRKAAEAAQMPVSRWLARSAERSVKNANLLASIAEYEREHGEITEVELERAQRAWLASH